MIFEFAIEPKLVASWHSNEKIELYKSRIGLGTGGILSNYPRNWIQLTKVSLNQEIANNKSIKNIKRVKALIQIINRNKIQRKNLIWDHNKS